MAGITSCGAEKDASLKARQKTNFDNRHLAKNLSDLSPGERVWLPDQIVEGTVLSKAGTPRSYAVGPQMVA